MRREMKKSLDITKILSLDLLADLIRKRKAY